jgi:hypothetical protein
MALQQVNIVDPYLPWTGWGDYAFNDDVNAITEYIENQRPQIKVHPDLQPIIEQYESWLTQLSWFEKYMTPDTALGKAVYYRDQVNAILGHTVDPTITTGDVGKKIVPVDPKQESSPLSDFLTQIIPKSLINTVKYTLYGTIILATGGAVVYLFGPAIRTIASKKVEKHFSKNDIISPPQGNVP